MLKGTTTPKAPQDSAATTPDGRSAFLHFITDDGREFGFPFSQLLHFVLEPNPQPATGSTAPPQRLLLAFPSHDITLTGYRLHLLCDWLDQQRALRLKAEDTRFANLHDKQPFVTGIAIGAVSSVQDEGKIATLWTDFPKLIAIRFDKLRQKIGKVRRHHIPVWSLVDW